MSALSIQVPFPVFQDRDGQPLDNGYVWIGTANLYPITSPVVAYFDEALTIIAAQPLRTINGYISNSGTPAQVFVDGVNFSILVQDSKGSMVYSFPDGSGISPDACGVTYDPPFTGGAPYPVCEKLSQTVSVIDFGADPTGVAASTAAIQAAEDACDVTGQTLWFPGGTYKCLTTIAKKSVNWCGDGQRTTTLAYYGNDLLINATGTNSSRILCTISDIGLDGTNAGTAARGITFGWNQRATPLMQSVYIAHFGHYGIHFNDQNWILVFNEVSLAACGASTNDSTGIYKEPSVDLSTWNGITFNGLVVEFCGNVSSVAGGMKLLTSNATRGVYFNDCLFEDNLGSNELLVTNTIDLQFNNLYMERTDVAGQVYGANIVGCQGGFYGGYISGAGAANHVGIYLDDAVFEIDAVNMPGWTVASVQNFSSRVYTSSNANNPFVTNTFSNGDAAAQWFGDYAPRVSFNKNATDQTGIVSGVFTKVTFPNEIYDLTGAYSSSKFIPKSLGTYQINCAVTFTAASDQDTIILSIYVNGFSKNFAYLSSSGTGTAMVQINAQVQIINVLDEIEIYVRQTSGTNKTISGSIENTYFMASLIGRV
jgi:hypothetical protein